MSKPYPSDLRPWWWSRQPFWNYLALDFNGRPMGWATLVDKHPGLFNLAWLVSGVNRPPVDYREYVGLTDWVFTDACHIPMGGRTMADWALDAKLSDFKYVFESDARVIKKWNFRESAMTYDKLSEALARRAGSSARL